MVCAVWLSWLRGAGAAALCLTSGHHRNDNVYAGRRDDGRFWRSRHDRGVGEDSERVERDEAKERPIRAEAGQPARHYGHPLAFVART